MPSWIAYPLILLGAYGTGCASAAIIRRRQHPPTPRKAHVVTAPDPRAVLLAPAPTVYVEHMGQIVLRDWLRNYSRYQDGAWVGVVKDFYAAAGADPRVAGYFPRGASERLQRHMVATLMRVTGEGLTVGDVEALVAAHADIRDGDGEPITGEAFDAVVTVLGGVLVERGVPGSTIGQLVKLTSICRDAMVQPTAAWG